MTAHESRPRVYVFVGPEKTGTTTIFDLLPFGQIPVQKEMFNLSRRCNMRAEMRRIDAQLGAQKVAFIVEPTYFVSDFARQVLAELATRYELHVIHTRRDPVERMVSHYLHHKAKGRVSDPESAVATYPEIVNASHYEKHAVLWREAVEHFHVIDVTDRTDFSTALNELGIKPCTSGPVESNRRMAPRSLVISRLASTLWQLLVNVKVNRIVPVSLRNWAKSRVYYGGTTVEVSEEERKCLKRMLSTTV